MKLPCLAISILVFMASLLVAGEPFRWGDEELVGQRMALQQGAVRNVSEQDDLGNSQSTSQKSVKKSVIFSALVPGAGQFYSQSYIKGAVFAAVEAGAWVLFISYNKKGKDKETEFHNYADQNWSEYRYWSYVAYRAAEEMDNPPIPLNSLQQQNMPDGRTWYLIPQDQYNAQLINELRTTEGQLDGFSHHLPETKTQQYYEMIGKYPAQFGYAWEDATFNPSKPYSGYTPNYTEKNNYYEGLRDDSNHFYNVAGYGAMTALVNHVISAIDAGFTARRFNRSHAVQMEMSYNNLLYKGEYVNMFGVNLRW
jgi:hypothetical protein